MGTIEKKKLRTGVFAAPPIVFLIVIGPGAVTFLMVLVATFLGLREFYNLAVPKTDGVERFAGMVLGLCFSLIIPMEGMAAAGPFLALVLLSLSILFMGTSKDLSSAIPRLGITVLGILYVGFLLSHVSLIRLMPEGKEWVLLLIATVWAGDISAFLSGSFFGRHKLYPKISPNKTFEGLAGAIAGSIIAAVAFAQLFIPRLGTGSCILMGLGLGIFGQLGDFTESMLKRSAHVKDSGSLIPGHGGMLDRLDSFLFTAPFLHYALLYFLKETP
jgi:phosphatidate cytidylyltransferase